MTRNKVFYSVGIILLLVAAFFLRTWNINHLPAGLWIDEAVNAADAHAALETGHFQLFYPNNYGREGFFINLQALSLWAFGESIFALKLWSAIFGTLAVLGTYLLGKELFGRRAPAFFAAFSLAFGYWAINFSRIGFRAIMTPTFLAFAFYFFFKGLRTEKKLPFLFSGLFIGLGLHGYIASRLVPGILILLVPFLFLTYEHFLRRFWKHGLAFLLGALISAGPMLYHFFWSHPEHFASRSAAVSIFSPEVNQGNLVGTFLTTLTLSLQKYNFIGDANWRHNYPPLPLLDPITGIFFLSGFLFLVLQWFQLLWRRIRTSERDTRLLRNSFLLATFFVLLAPEFLTKEGVPHALRAIGTQIPVFLISGFAIHWLYRYGERSLPLPKKVFHTLVILLLLGAASINVIKYFSWFRNAPEQKASFTYTQVHIANYLATLPPEQIKYIATHDRSRIEGNGYPIDVQPLAFYTYKKVENIIVLQPGTDQEIFPGSILVMLNDDKVVVQKILELYPASRTEKIDLEPGTFSDFTVIHIQ